MTVRKTLYALPAIALFLASCGGSDSEPAPDYAVSAGILNLLATGGSWTMAGTTSDGSSFTIMLDIAPAAPTVFAVTGATVDSTLETFTVISGGSPGSTTQSIYRDPSTAAVVGLDAEGACSVSTSQPALPAKARIAATGAIVAVSDLDGCASDSQAVGTTTFDWSLQADKGATLLCWNLTSRDTSGTTNGTESICTEIAPDGTLGHKATFSIASGGLSASARNY